MLLNPTLGRGLDEHLKSPPAIQLNDSIIFMKAKDLQLGHYRFLPIYIKFKIIITPPHQKKKKSLKYITFDSLKKLP